MPDDTYASPRARPADAGMLPDGDLIAAGRAVPAGNGWRWIADAWAFTGPQRGTFIGITLLLALIWIALSFVPLLGPLALALGYPLIAAGLLLGCAAVQGGQRLEVTHLFAGFKHRASGRLLALGALSIAASVVCSIIMVAILGAGFGTAVLVGSPTSAIPYASTVLLAVLVVLALSVPVMMAMWFAVPLIVFNDLAVIDAVKVSFLACLKNIAPFLVWSVVVLVLSIVASIPLMLGWLLLGPTLWASMFVVYHDVFYAS